MSYLGKRRTMHTIGASSSLNFELFRSIDSDFGLSFVQLDSASDLDPAFLRCLRASEILKPAMPAKSAGKSLIRVSGANIEERVSAFRSEDLCNHSLNGRVFADVTGRKIGWNNGRGLGLNERRTTAGQNGCQKGSHLPVRKKSHAKAIPIRFLSVLCPAIKSRPAGVRV